MTRVRFYIGETYGNGMDVADGAFEAIEKDLIEKFGGFTRFNAKGGWRSPDDRIVREPSRVYEVIDTWQGATRVNNYEKDASLYARQASQECVLWTEDEIKGGFANAQG